MLLYLCFVFGLLSHMFLTTSSGLFDCHLDELLQFILVYQSQTILHYLVLEK